MDSLQLVDLMDNANKPIDGLVSVHDFKSIDDPHERAVLLQARSLKHIEHVFFRRFIDPDGKQSRSSQVAAYVIDNSRQRLTEGQLADLHHKLWLHGVAPLIYVAWPTRIDILTCAREPDFWVDGAAHYRPAARIESSSDGALRSETGKHAIRTAAAISDALARRFSAYRLAEGTFWDDPDNQRLAKESAAAHRSLIHAIVEADSDLEGANRPVLRRLLVLMVLIKYLEDREVFPRKLFGRFHKGAKSFLDILRKGSVEEVLRLLRYFENKFNGDVFSLGNDADKLTQAELKRFAKFVEAKDLGGYQHFWELFSFEHIPVEVISRLYQRFVTGHGAVYTPPFLAALLLDQVMSYERMTGKEKILDPACGSGIFLVGAFKRLVIHWRSRHKWRKPTADNLKEILAHSIHGVELEAGAVDLTAFSLALAVCDALPPPVIWKSLKFDKLRGRNLREGDSFDQATFTSHEGHGWTEKFDIVIGNPPFESNLTPPAKAIDAARPISEPQVPDNQVAYLFLEQGLKWLAPGGSLCLIQPHGLLYNSKTVGFRRHLMSLCRLDTVLDFVSIRGLYEGADPKTIAWHAIQDSLADRPVNHLTFRRTYSTAERIAFEIDHYDWHVVSQHQAIENPFVWRVSLLGGGRLHELSRRFHSMTTLSEFVSNKGSQWRFGEGVIPGTRDKDGSFLYDELFLPTDAFSEEGIDEGRLETLKENRFQWPRTLDQFTPPLILIKEHTTLPMAFWDRCVLGYRAKIVGIHAPPQERDTLFNVFEMLKTRNRFYQFFCSLNGIQAGLGKATAITKNEIERLPFPEDASRLTLAFWEEALKEDVLNYLADYIRLGQDSNSLKKAATRNDLREYGALFVRMLGSLYHNLQPHAPILLNGLIAQPFYFGSKPDVSWLGKDCEDALHRLIYDESRQSLRSIRVVRYYEGNVILIVKPDRLRYWIRSTAIRDADDTLVELREQGW